MEVSKRLNWILEYMKPCTVAADIGTDHGYAVIEMLKRNIAEKMIATDINKGPLEKAKFNVSLEGLKNKVDFRLGGGFEPLKEGETDGVLIAGMGGNLIRDILEHDLNKVKKTKYLVLQPAQNPEVLRKYLYNSYYEIIDESVCFDEGKFYELFLIQYKENSSNELKYDGNKDLEDLYYEISPVMLKKDDKVFKEYLNAKLENYIKISGFLKGDTENSLKRKKELQKKIEFIQSKI